MVNSEKLKKRISERGFTESEIADRLNISIASLSLKISNKRPMRLEDVEKLQILLQIPDDQIKDYFFYH